MRQVTFAATQFQATADFDENIANAETMVKQAAEQGANAILLQELFAGFYWCKDQDAKYFSWADKYESSKVLQHFSVLAKRIGVVLPISYFEKSGNTFFNSLAMIDSDGRVMDNYRKSHIPEGCGYHEKFYFTPGDSGFKVWETKLGLFGAAICWDQWYPEVSRVLALKGAEVIFYPTAIGSEPHDPNWDSRSHWQTVMQGHSAANMIPVIAANRIGKEVGDSCEIDFYGSSFITDQFGTKVQEMDTESAGVICQQFDLDELAKKRIAWGLFRDRRPELYGRISRH
ncbi:N-carbamoylputrescine amidase [Aliikangiella coralliicola]|uniref:N-carbamoylputrescine amidase n=1 Tax=Aliikangiella coralliicola TaxID=2592383 RepID=A0A545UBI4_9GAMM|nr:N-carbamoylputrescine amidase [Aliikangiella coralliicola]TQV86831.1 N-carbamoylputrescine amidase [Aliikangiella coralliicola]